MHSMLTRYNISDNKLHLRDIVHKIVNSLYVRYGLNFGKASGYTLALIRY